MRHISLPSVVTKSIMPVSAKQPSVTAAVRGLLMIGLIVLTWVFSVTSVHAQISGTVFRDFNADGVRSFTAATPLEGETGVGGVTVTIYSGTAVVASAVSSTATATAGQYSISTSTTGPFRVVFTNLPAGFFATRRGATGGNTPNGTTVQFAPDNTEANINLGINYPRDYCQANPDLITTCYVNGNPISTAATTEIRTASDLIRFPFTATGAVNAGTGTAYTTLGQAQQVGSIHGLTYQRTTGRVFASQILKRHVGFGPSVNNANPGGVIYTVTGSTPSILIDLRARGINVGPIPSNDTRNLALAKAANDTDPLSFSLIGKVGLGDLEISEDEQTLYTVNLFDRKVYAINIASASTTSYVPTALPDFPNPGCVNGVARPFGLKVYRDKLYLGVVCTAEATAGTTANIRAYVYEYNPANNTWTTAPLIDIPLNYDKGQTYAFKDVAEGRRWNPWRDDAARIADNDLQLYPMALLSDLEFDADGSLHLAFMDRHGHQRGYRNLTPDGARIESGVTGGDLLRTYRNPTTGVYTLEANGTAGPYVSSGTGDATGTGPGGPNTNQGPGTLNAARTAYTDPSGEFYWSDFFNRSDRIHSEMIFGGIAYVPGSQTIIASFMDPIDVDAGGLTWFDIGNGSRTQNYQLYVESDNDALANGKANGVGDVEALCNPAPIEIGNRLFNDGDFLTADGTQGNGNAGSNVAGAVVVLYRVGNATPIASTTTNSAGEYYFNSTTVPGLLPNTAYEIRVALNQFATPTTVTRANASIDDLSDSDALLQTIGGVPTAVISLTTGDYGENNHSYDIGFIRAPASIGDFVFEDLNRNGIQDTGEPGIAGVAVQLLTGTNTVVFSTTTNTSGIYSFTGLTPTVSYSVVFSAPTGYTATLVNQGANDALDSDADPTTGRTISYTLSAGQSLTTVDAGFYRSASIGDRVFVDANRNGIQDTGEGGLAGVTVQLLTGTNTVVASTTTNASGIYSFTGLTPGVSYSVAFGQPANYSATLANQGGNDAVDSDASATTGRTGSYTLTSGQSLTTVDAGFYCIPPSVTATASSNAVCVGQRVTLNTQVSAGGSFTVTAPTGVTLSSATASTITTGTLPTGVNTFTITASNSPVCFTTTTVSVTVSNTPVITLTASPSAICVGQTVNLSVAGVPLGGVVTFGTQGPLGTLVNPVSSGTFSPTATTTFVASVAVPGVGGLLGSVLTSCPVTVTVNQPPVIPPLGLSACVGTALNLSALTGTGGSLSALTGLTNVFRPGSLSTGAALTGPVAVTAGVNTFNVISTNPLGCSAAAAPISVTGIAAPALPATLSLSVCAGTSLNLSALTGTGASLSALTGLTNVFRTGSTTAGVGITAPVSVSAGANLFNVTSTNPAGCSANAPITVTGLATPALTPVSASLCVGLPLNLTSVLGTNNTLTGLTNGLLTGGLVTALPTNLTVGAGVNTFNVVSTNANGCTAVTGVTVTGLARPALNPVSVSLCVGQPLSLTSVLDGGTGNTLTGLTNTLLGGAALPTSLTVGAGVNVFNVVSTNASGCSAVTPITVTGLATPTLTPASVSLCVGLPLNLTSVLGTNNTLTGLTNTLLGGSALPTSLTVGAGVNVFNVVSTNASGCSAVTPVTVTGLATPTLSPVSASLCIGLPLNLTSVLGTGNTLTGLTNTLLGGAALPTSLTVGAGVNVFNVVSTSANGCSVVTGVTVTGLARPALNPVSVSLCVGQPLSLTSVLDGGTGNTLTGLTNTLLGGAALPTSLTVGAGVNVFNVVSTNASGCSAVTPITVTGLATPALTPASVSLCVGLPLNLTSVLGTGNTLTGLTSTLLGGSALPTSLSVGAGVNVFNVVSTNASGCSAVTPITVTGLAAPALTPASVSLCVGLPLNLTGVLGTGNVLTGLTNTLLGGAALPTNLTVGAGVNVFNVVSTNASGCSAVTPITVTGLATPALTPVSVSLCVGLPLNLTSVLGTGNTLTGLTNTVLGGSALPTSLTVGAGVNVFNVVSTNASGCTAVTPITVTGLATPALTPASVSLCVGLPLNLTSVLGTGNVLTGLTSTLLGGAALPTSLTVGAGVNVFNVVSTNTSGCTAVTPVTVTGLANPVLTPASVSLCVGLPLNLTSVLGTGNVLTGLTSTLLGGTALPTSLTVGAGVNVFNVVSTNASGCTAVTPITVTGLATPTLTPASVSLCVGLPLSLTSVLDAGTGNTLTGLTNTLLGGTALPTSLTVGAGVNVFNVVSANASGCTVVTPVTVTGLATPTLSPVSVSLCVGLPLNLTSVLGTGNTLTGLTNTLLGGAALPTSLSVGAGVNVFNVVSTNASGCTAVTPITVTGLATPALTPASVSLCVGLPLNLTSVLGTNNTLTGLTNTLLGGSALPTSLTVGAGVNVFNVVSTNANACTVVTPVTVTGLATPALTPVSASLCIGLPLNLTSVLGTGNVLTGLTSTLLGGAALPTSLTVGAGVNVFNVVSTNASGCTAVTPITVTGLATPALTPASVSLCVGLPLNLTSVLGTGNVLTGLTSTLLGGAALPTSLTVGAGVNVFNVVSTNASGCTAVTPITVTGLATPALTPASVSLCVGLPLNLTSVLGTGNVLTGLTNTLLGGTALPTSLTVGAGVNVFNVVSTNASGCSAVTPITVTGLAAPALTPASVSLCVGLPLNLTGVLGTGNVLTGLTNTLLGGAALPTSLTVGAGVNVFNVVSTNASGCTVVTPVTVTGLATPALTPVSVSLCVGLPLNLTGVLGTNNTLTGLISTLLGGATLPTSLSVGAGVNVFNVVSTNASGCTVVTPVTVTGLITPVLTPVSVSLCVGQPLSLTSILDTGTGNTLTGLTNTLLGGSALPTSFTVGAGVNVFNVVSTNASGCSAVTPITVTGLATPALTPASVSLCVGLPLNLTSVLGTGNVLTGLTNTLLGGSALPTSLSVGAGVNVFNVVSTNASGCSAVTPITVTGLATPALTPASVSLCVGLPLNLTSVLGTGNVLTGLTSTLLGGAALPTSLSVGAGVNVFNIVSTNASGCSAVTPITVTGLAAPALIPVSVSLCVGLPLNLTGVLGTGNVLTGLTSTLLGGAALPTSLTVGAGVNVFNVVSTNASGCTVVTPLTVTGLAAPALTPASVSLCVGLPLNLTSVLGTGNVLTGLTSTLLGGSALPASLTVGAGVNVFNVVSTNASGCTAVTPITVTGLATPALTPASVSLCVGLPLNLTSVLGTGNVLTGLTNTLLGGTALPTSLSVGAGVNVFNAVSTNASGCSAVTPITVTGLAAPALTPVSVSLCVGLPLNLTGILGTSTANTLTGLTNTLLGGTALPTSLTVGAGVNVFNVVSTNASGCSAVTPITVTGLATPALTPASVSLCVGLPLNLTGVLGTGNVLTGLTSTLLGGAALPTSLTVGAGVNVFNVVSTNASGCTAVTPITVTGLATPALTPISLSLCVGSTLDLTSLSGLSGLTGNTNVFRLGDVLGIGSPIGTPNSVSIGAGLNLFNLVSTNPSGCSAATPITVIGIDLPDLTPINVSLCVGTVLDLTNLLGSPAPGTIDVFRNTITGITITNPTAVTVGLGVNLFSVISTNAQGCSAVAPISVTGVATPTLTPVSVSLCAQVGSTVNLNTVLANATGLPDLINVFRVGTGLVGPLVADPTAVSLTAGANVFTTVSTNANGCANTTQLSIVLNPLPILTPTSISLCAGLGTTVDLGTLLTGPGSLTGLNTVFRLGDATGGIVTTPSTVSLGAGVNLFTAISTNPAGCTAATPISITAVAAPVLSPIALSLCAGTSLDLAGLVTPGGSLSALVGLGNVFRTGSSVLTTPVAVNAGANVFNVVSTNASGCTAVTPITVTGLATPVLTPASVSLCVGLPLNLTSVLGTGNTLTGLTNTLLGGAALPTSLSVGAGVNVFNVVSTNASGCTAVTPVTVTGLAAPALTPANVSLCVGLPLNLTSVLGTGNALTGLTNTLLGGSALPTSLTVGAGVNVFNVVSTNTSGCTAVTPITVTGLATPALTPASVSLCVGLPLNLTSVLGTGNTLTGLTNTLLGGSALPTSLTVGAGVNVFNVVSTNASGCSAVTPITVTGLAAPALTPVSVSLCVGLPLNLTGVLGTGNVLTGLTSTLLGGAALPTSLTVGAGVNVFNVVSTNASGCSAVTPITVTGLAAPALTPTSVSLCVGLPLNLTGVLGTNNTLTGLTNILLGGAALPTNLTVGAGINAFNVVSTNASGCTAVTPITVTGLATPALTPVSVTLCVGLPLNLTGVLGTGNVLTGLTSTLLGGAALPTSLSVGAGVNVFNVVSTNANACTVVTPVTVTGLATPTLSPVSVSLCVGQPLSLTSILDTGTGNTLTGLTTALLTGGTVTALPTNLTAGVGVNVFNVVSTNTSGCSAVTPITVTGLATPALTPASVSLCVGLPLNLTSVLGTGNTLTGLTNTLLGGSALPTSLTVGAGVNVFNVVSTNASGCSAVTPITVTGLATPALTPASVSLCVGLPLNLTSVLGTGNTLTGLTTTLLGGAALPTSLTVGAGVNVFNVVSTNASGCSAVTPITVTGLANPVLTPASVSLCVGLPLNLTSVLGTGNTLTGLTNTLLGGSALPTSLTVGAGVNLFNVVSTNASGCTAVTPITVTGLATPALTPVSVSLCVGLPLNLTSVLGTGNVLTGLTNTLLGGSALPTSLSVGAGVNVFNVVSTNASGCSAVTPITVTGLDAPALTPASVSLCVGLPLNLTSVLGAGNVLTGLTNTLLGGTALPTSLTVGVGVNVFNVVSTNASGCTAVTPITVTGLDAPALTPASVSLCVGLPLNLTSVLGAGNVLTGLTNTLLGGSALPTSLTVGAGVNVFNVISTNASGCTTVTPITVTGLANPVLTPASVSLCVGLPLNLTSVLGTGNVLTGLTSTLLGGSALPTSLTVGAGVNVFNVVSTNASDCSVVTPITVTGLTTPTLSPVSVSLCVGQPLSLTSILDTGAGNTLTGLTSTLLGGVALPTSLTVGAGVNVFNVVSTNVSGCSAVTPITVTGLTAPALTPVSVSLCVGLPLNLTSILGTGNVLTGLTSTLLGGAALPTDLIVGAGVNVFDVVSTNASGCLAVTPITVTGLTVPALTPASVSLCVGLPLNLTSVLGTGNVLTGLTNTLLGGAALPTSLTVGAGVNVFNVVSTNASGCSAVTPITVTGLAAPALTPASVSLCVGLPLNLTSVLGTGNVLTGLNSTLLGGAALPTSLTVGAGVNVFNVVSTNASGCTAVTPVTVTGLDAPALTPVSVSLCVDLPLNLTSVLGMGNVLTGLTSTLLGGSALPTSLTVGAGVNVFNVVSTNTSGCTAVTPITVTGLANPALTPASVSLCVGLPLNLTGVLGTGNVLTGLTSTLLDGAALPTSLTVGAGVNVFNVVSTNASGCSAVTPVTVTGLATPTLSPVSVSLCVGQPLSLISILDTGAGNTLTGLTNTLLGGAALPTSLTVGAGVNVFNVVSTNASGCSAVTPITVTGLAAPSLTPVSVSLCVGLPLNLTSVLGAGNVLTGLTNTLLGGAALPTSLTVGAGVNVFNVISTNASGCTAVTPVTVTGLATPTLSPMSVSLCVGQPLSLISILDTGAGNTLTGLTNTLLGGAALPTSLTVGAGVNVFNVVSTNASDCSVVTPITVTGLTTPTLSPVSVSLCVGQPLSLTSILDTGAGNTLTGLTSTLLGGVALPTSLTVGAGVNVFNVVSTNVSGCSAVTPITVTGLTAPALTPVSVSLCVGLPLNLTSILGTGNVLTGLTSTLLGGAALPTDLIVGAGVNVFDVVSTNASGCLAVTPITVTGLTVPALTPASVSLCVGLPLNLTSVLGTGNVLTGLTNTLLGGAALPTSLTVGAGVNVFNVVSTNASGCSAVTPITVTGLAAPALTPASVSLCVGLPLNLTSVLGTNNTLTGLNSTLLGGAALPTSLTVGAGVNVFNVVSTNASGCSAVTPVTVTGLDAPVLSPIALSLCVGTSLDLTSLTGLAGLDNVFRTGDVLGLGTVLGVPTSVSIGLGANLFNVVSTNPAGCTAAAPISVTGVAVPDLSPISLSLCVGATVDLTNLTGLAGLTNVFFTGDVSGTGTVIGTPTSVSIGAGVNLFNVVSTNPAGCTAVTPISVIGVDAPELTPISASLCVGTVLDLTDLVSNLPAGFTTTFLNSAGIAVTNPAAVTIGAGANLFTVVSTNALGCSAVAPISVTGVATPTLTPVSISLCAAVGTTVNLNTVLANATGLSGLNNVFRIGTGTLGAIIGDPTAVSLAAGVNVFTAVSTNATSCSNTTQLSIVLNPVPVLPPVSVSLCAPIGTTVDLNALLSGATNLSGLTTVFRAGGATGGIITTPSTVSLSAGVNLFTAIGTNGSNCADTTQISVNLLVQPVVSIGLALQSQTICAGTQPAPIVATVLSGTVASSQFFGPLTTTTGSLGVAISGATSLTFTPTAVQLPVPGQTSFFALVTTGAPGCSDTTFVSVTVNPQPVATAASVSICLGESANLGAQLTVLPGTTSAFFATALDAQAGVNPLVNLTVSPTVSTTFFTRVTLPLTGCFRIDSIRVTVNAKPSAGTDQTLVCNGDGTTPTSTTLAVVSADAGTWSQLTGEPATIALPNSATTSVSSLTAGSYSFVFTTVTGCSDTVNVTVPVCQQLGSIGDFVWNDLNNNGRQDAGEPGVDGIRLTLFVETTPGQFTSLSSVVTQTVNGQAGFYTFTGLATGNYRVQLDKTTLPTSFSISPDANRPGVPDNLDSDFDPASGFSSVVAINTALPNGDLGRNNPTVDAAITNQCPPAKCVPFVIQRTRTALRTGR